MRLPVCVCTCVWPYVRVLVFHVLDFWSLLSSCSLRACVRVIRLICRSMGGRIPTLVLFVHANAVFSSLGEESNMSESSMMTPAKTATGLVLGGHSGSPVLQGLMTSSGGIILTQGSTINNPVLMNKSMAMKNTKKAVSINKAAKSG